MVGLVGECFMFASVLIHWFWLFSQFWNDLFSKLISLATCWERLLSSVEPTFSPIGEHCFSWGRRRQHLAQWRPIFPRAAWNGCAHHKQTRIFGGRRWLKRSQPLRSSHWPLLPTCGPAYLTRDTARWWRRDCRSSEASPKAPITMPWTLPREPSLRSTGPVVSLGVPH